MRGGCYTLSAYEHLLCGNSLAIAPHASNHRACLFFQSKDKCKRNSKYYHFNAFEIHKNLCLDNGFKNIILIFKPQGNE
jgi:hypothetical protein